MTDQVSSAVKSTADQLRTLSETTAANDVKDESYIGQIGCGEASARDELATNFSTLQRRLQRRIERGPATDTQASRAKATRKGRQKGAKISIIKKKYRAAIRSKKRARRRATSRRARRSNGGDSRARSRSELAPAVARVDATLLRIGSRRATAPSSRGTSRRQVYQSTRRPRRTKNRHRRRPKSSMFSFCSTFDFILLLSAESRPPQRRPPMSSPLNVLKQRSLRRFNAMAGPVLTRHSMAAAATMAMRRAIGNLAAFRHLSRTSSLPPIRRRLKRTRRRRRSANRPTSRRLVRSRPSPSRTIRSRPPSTPSTRIHSTLVQSTKLSPKRNNARPMKRRTPTTRRFFAPTLRLYARAQASRRRHPKAAVQSRRDRWASKTISKR